MTGPCSSCTEYVADNYRLQTTTDNPGKIQKLVYTEKKDKQPDSQKRDRKWRVHVVDVHRNRRLIRDGNPGRPPRLSHSSWAQDSQVGPHFIITVKALTVTTFKHTSLQVLQRLTEPRYWHRPTNRHLQYNTTLLPSVNTLIARGMFCSAKYTHHTFTPIIKHLLQQQINKYMLSQPRRSLT